MPSHSNSFGNNAEKDTAGCRASDRKYIVIGGEEETKPSGGSTYTVKSGDSLWKIAKQLYGSGADWKKIYEANKDVIGSNPNLIYPGQTFTIPG